MDCTTPSHQPLRILLLTHSFNSLSQRLFVELREAGHQVSVEFDIHDSVTEEAVERFQPDLLIAPFLKRAIPESVWSQIPALVIHPGPPGDRGPSALDGAILRQEKSWGVTLLQANAVMDGGDVWGYEIFPMKEISKGSLYRKQVTEAATRITLGAIKQWQDGTLKIEPQSGIAETAQQQTRPVITQQDRSIQWKIDDLPTVLRKINSADGSPGLLDTTLGRPLYLYDAHPEPNLSGEPGTLIAQSGAAICIATADQQGVWVGQLRDANSNHPFKRPATEVLGVDSDDLPQSKDGYQDIVYQEQLGIGLLYFPFYNGAMSSERCRRLQQALQQAKQADTRAILLLGGSDYWSNGMDLNQIEASESPADASWENIQAMDDLALEIINSEQQLIISVLQGNAAAGGVILARAADQVWARDGVILNPHYKDMGNLYGSEYWSYLLPHYCGVEAAEQITQARLPMGTPEAERLGLIDQRFDSSPEDFVEQCIRTATTLIQQPDFPQKLEKKQQQRQNDEATRPLSSYREQELEQMRMNFYGFDPSYHIARYNFVHKVPKSRTPVTLALHRSKARS